MAGISAKRFRILIDNIPVDNVGNIGTSVILISTILQAAIGTHHIPKTFTEEPVGRPRHSAASRAWPARGFAGGKMKTMLQYRRQGLVVLSHSGELSEALPHEHGMIYPGGTDAGRDARSEWAQSVRKATGRVQHRAWGNVGERLDPPAALLDFTVVLLAPKFATSLSSTARAMNCFECEDLRIVAPRTSPTNKRVLRAVCGGQQVLWRAVLPGCKHRRLPCSPDASIDGLW
ncbi:hypothetical protein CYMTET_19063 [Cymbomonas tetramitiformis]|uniref:Uncharacterized protein n=1 Tax=Cymbomonas tetramitiformis TaxID=36881 RepID=A0AAE0G6Y0_9CHLO|nr:hypothetical protein CYMTET_19063 [Cymbomonas tetramitiformis]